MVIGEWRMADGVWQMAYCVMRSAYRVARQKIFIFLLLSFYFLVPTLSKAQDGGTAGALLNYGMTPRTLAMGKTFTGLADDQEAVYFNPAGLVQLMSHNVKSAYLSLLGTNLGYLGYALPTKRFGSIGLGLVYHGTPEIDSYNSAGDPFGTFKFNENAFLFSYAHQPATWIGLGLSVKVLATRIAQFGALGMGGDLGAMILPRRDLTFGIAVQNILGPRLTYRDNGPTDEVPLTFRVGTAIKLYKGRVILGLDVVKDIIESSSVKPHFGIEFMPVKPLLALRGGIDQNHVSAGAGIRHDWNKLSLGFDYAVLFHYSSSYLVPYRHKIGININFAGFRTWVDAEPKRFSPTPGRKENVAWMDLHYNTKREIERWQLLVKNQFGEVVRTYGGWDAPPLRLSWDGLDDVGRVVSDGLYYYEIILIDEAGENYTYSDALTRVVSLGPEGEIEFLPQE